MNVTAIAKRETASTLEQVLIRGDLSKLNEADRNAYYLKVCESAGLNPLTQPFAYIVLNGKLTLYALRNCTDQLRSIHKVSVTEMSHAERDGVFVVTVKVATGDGRTDMATGAVNIANLKGEALANAFMKTETKAKRRATLSICGLGLLDETEVETIPGARTEPPAPAPVAIAKPAPVEPSADAETGEVGPRTLVVRTVPLKDGSEVRDWAAFGRLYLDAVESAMLAATVDEWEEANAPILAQMEKEAPKIHASVTRLVDKHRKKVPPF